MSDAEKLVDRESDVSKMSYFVETIHSKSKKGEQLLTYLCMTEQGSKAS